MLIYAPINTINDNPYQKRTHYGEIGELAADIHRHKPTRPDTLGLQQVPTARIIFRSAAETRILTAADVASVINDNGRFAPPRSTHIELEFGHRRLRALRLLAETDLDYAWVPLNIMPLTDEDMLNGVWSENEARKNLSDVERAELIRAKLDTGLTQQQVADAWGLARPTISNLLSLLSLPPEIQSGIRDGRLPTRTAQALRDVDRIAQAVKNDNWKSRGAGKYMTTPTPPADYIKNILEKPADVTSDDVRDYVNNALKFAGDDLPDVIIKFTAAPAKNIVQADGCKGCPYRINSQCLRRPCLTAKMDQAAQATLTAVSDKLGIPISTNPDDFKPSANDWRTRADIRHAWGKGIEADWVIGWLDHKHDGFRPFADGTYIGDKAALFANDGRAGIVIAPRGGYLSEDDLRDLAALEAAAKGENVETAVTAADIAGPAQQKEWETQAVATIRTMQKQATEAMVDALYLPLGESEDIIQALLFAPGKEMEGEYEKFVAAFVKFLWQKGDGALGGIGSYQRPMVSYRAINDLLRRAGLKPIQLKREETAVLALSFWYAVREFSYSYNENWPQAITDLEGLLATWPEMGSGETLDTLRYELSRALTDARAKLADRTAKEQARAAARAAADQDNPTTEALPDDDNGDEYDEYEDAWEWAEEEEEEEPA